MIDLQYSEHAPNMHSTCWQHFGNMLFIFRPHAGHSAAYISVLMKIFKDVMLKKDFDSELNKTDNLDAV